MMHLKNDNRAFVSLLGLLLTIALMAFLVYKGYGTYLTKSTADKETKKALGDSGIDTSNQMATFESTKSKIKDVNKLLLDREQKIFETSP